MKRLLSTSIITLFALLMALSAMASQVKLDKILEKLSNDNSVTMAYLSPDLIRSLNNLNPSGYNLSKISHHATSIKVFVCQSLTSQALAEEYVREREKMKPYPVLLTKVKNGPSSLDIFGIQKEGRAKTYSSIIFLSKKGKSSRMLILEGEFDFQDIASLSSQAGPEFPSTSSSSFFPEFVINNRSYGPKEPYIARMEKPDSKSDQLELVFIDPSGKLAEDPVVNIWNDDTLITYRAFYKEVKDGNAVYKFRVPQSQLKRNKSVVFYLDNRKYTRML